MDEEREYTYEDLVKLGEEATNQEYNVYSKAALSAIELLKYPSTTVPVVRNGTIEWVTKFKSNKEKDTYIRMVVGMNILNTRLYKEAVSITSVLRQPDGFGQNTYTPVGIYKAANNEDDAPHKYDQAANVWNIPRHMDVSSKAALFYLLYTRSIRGDKRATDELEFFIAKLGRHIKNYLDLAAGGELRHMLNDNYTWNASMKFPEDVKAEAFDNDWVYIDKTGMLALRGFKVSKAGMGLTSRSQAWIKWKAVREQAGIAALDWCILQHCLSTRGGFGGALWANCANLVRKLELGQVSTIFFVDQAFSLQHNGGAIFNKMWSINNLQQVLDLAFRGEAEKLERFLHNEDLDQWKKMNGKVTVFDLTKKDAHLEKPRKEIESFERSAVLGLSAQKELLDLIKVG